MLRNQYEKKPVYQLIAVIGQLASGYFKRCGKNEFPEVVGK